MKRIGTILAALSVLAITGGATADMISDSYDYWLPMGEGGPGLYFDHLQMKIDTPAGFLTPVGYENGIGTVYPTDPSWSQTYNDGTILLADGGRTEELYFTLYFSDASQYVFHLQAWDASTLVDNVDVLKNAGGWWNTGAGTNVLPGTWQSPRLDTVVPLPGAMVLAMIGFASVGALKGRRL